MKNNFLVIGYKLVFVIFSCSVLAAPPSLLANREQEHQKIVEKVTVTNVEVPLRVLYKGNPVTDLTKENFEIYEDKKKVKINGFFLKRKKIKTIKSGIKRTGLMESVPEEKDSPSRTFVLVFNITDYNKNIVRAVNHLFGEILRKNDRLLVFANDKTMEFLNLEKKEKIKRKLTINLKEESRKVRRRLFNYISKIETYLDVHNFTTELSLRQDFPADRLIDFLEKYLVTWNNYRKRYLTPRLDRFYFFSKYLENIKTEKWVFNFYQFELFPNIRMSSQTWQKIRDMVTQLLTSNEATRYAFGKMINGLLNRIYMSMNVSKNFPIEEVSKLFYKVDATFHSFFIRSINKAELNDLEYHEVASDIENTLKQITKITGGESITSNNLVKSLETVAEKEDVYYILTYVPLDPGKAGKLKVKIKSKDKKRYNVFYDDNFRADYISERLQKLEEQMQTPEIKINDFSFNQNILAFTVSHYQMKEIDEKSKLQGRAIVRIRITDKNNKSLYDQQRALTAQKTEIKISLEAFKKIKRGKYNFLIDALDLFTGKETNVHKNIVIKR